MSNLTLEEMVRAIRNHMCGNCAKRIGMSCNYPTCEDMASLRHATEKEIRSKYEEMKNGQ